MKKCDIIKPECYYTDEYKFKKIIQETGEKNLNWKKMLNDDIIPSSLIEHYLDTKKLNIDMFNSYYNLDLLYKFKNDIDWNNEGIYKKLHNSFFQDERFNEIYNCQLVKKYINIESVIYYSDADTIIKLYYQNILSFDDIILNYLGYKKIKNIDIKIINLIKNDLFNFYQSIKKIDDICALKGIIKVIQKYFKDDTIIIDKNFTLIDYINSDECNFFDMIIKFDLHRGIECLEDLTLFKESTLKRNLKKFQKKGLNRFNIFFYIYRKQVLQRRKEQMVK